jgi:nucleoside-diphosphate-sugar epimerase
MEGLIKSKATKWTIFRVSNIVGGGNNPLTLTNYLHHTIVNGLSFELWTKATRNLIDIDHVSSIIKYHIHHEPCNRIVNVANKQNYTLTQIVSEFERILNKKANDTEIAKGSGFTIDISDILHFLPLLQIEFDNNYLTNLLTKHYVKEE